MSCSERQYQENEIPYQCTGLTIEQTQEGEKVRRELLQLQDLQMGDGALAVWCRRMSADVEARYSDGSLVYKGEITLNEGFGFSPDLLVPKNRENIQVLSVEQRGLRLGLNGMAVGGKRRIVIDPKLVCSTVNECDFTNQWNGRGSKVRKETIIVEAILKDVCVPIVSKASSPVWSFSEKCRKPYSGYREPSSSIPIWHFYYLGADTPPVQR